MIPDDNSVRQKFLLGLTLSEISFIYLIIILLISLSYFIDYKKEEKERVAEVEKLKEENSSLKGEILSADILINDLHDLLGLSEKEKERNFQDREMDRRKFEEEQKKLRIAKEKYDKILEKHEDLKLDKDKMTPIVILEKFSEIMKQLEPLGTDNDSVDDKISDLVANSGKYESKKNELEKLQKDLEIFKKEVDKKGEGDGHGPPPCFFTESEESKRADKKRADYMYKIYVHKNKYEMVPNWKDKDKEQMEEIWNLIKVEKVLYKKSSASSRKKFTLSIKEFDKFGEIIFQHGEANECKHHTVVERSFKLKKNGVPDGKAYRAWDENFKIIDGYFYNYCRPCLRK